MVFAKDECNKDKVKITSIKSTEIKGAAVETNKPTISGLNVGLDLKMYDVDDSIDDEKIKLK